MQRLAVGRIVSSGIVDSAAWRRADPDERGDEVTIINFDQFDVGQVLGRDELLCSATNALSPVPIPAAARA
jgi:hypothetical protein